MRRRKSKNKQKCQSIHAKQRAKERFGLNLNTSQIVTEIQKNQLEFLEKQSNRVSLWRKIIDEIDVVFAYDKHRKQIVTVFSYEWYLERK